MTRRSLFAKALGLAVVPLVPKEPDGMWFVKAVSQMETMHPYLWKGAYIGPFASFVIPPYTPPKPMTHDLSQPWPDHIEWPETSASDGADSGQWKTVRFYLNPQDELTNVQYVDSDEKTCCMIFCPEDTEEREKLETAHYLNVVWPEICGEGSHE